MALKLKNFRWFTHLFWKKGQDYPTTMTLNHAGAREEIIEMLPHSLETSSSPLLGGSEKSEFNDLCLDETPLPRCQFPTSSGGRR